MLDRSLSRLLLAPDDGRSRDLSLDRSRDDTDRRSDHDRSRDNDRSLSRDNDRSLDDILSYELVLSLL